MAVVGSRALVDQVAAQLPRPGGAVELELASGGMLAVVVTGDEGAVSAIFRIDDEAIRAAPLLRLIGLYAGVVALATLLLAYFALTRLIVRPLDELTRAARRVAGGARSLTVPTSGAFELVELGSTLRSMTERLLAEEQALRRKITEVEEATKELEAAQGSLVRSERLASVGRLSAGLAHEVGNPLAALIGLEDLLLAGDLAPDEQRDFLLRMRKETERIHRIVRDLLEFARPDARNDSVFEPGDLALAVEETTALLKPQKAFTDVELELEVAEALPKLALRTAELVQIVLNLLLNAADACGPGGKVLLRVTTTDDGVQLEVRDNGPGVSADVVSQLFEPFVTTKEVGAGTGLGLAVCRGLVESVGGSIALDASFTDGARFVVQLPAARRLSDPV